VSKALYRRAAARRALGLIVLVIGFFSAVPTPGAEAKPPNRTTTTSSTTTSTTAPSSTTTTTVPGGGKVVYASSYGTSTSALQAAVDAAGGGTLLLQAGVVYSITSPVRLVSNLVVQGNGARLRTADNTTTSTTSEGILDITGASDVEVSGVTFDGNISGQTAWSQWRHAVRVLGSTNVRIHDNTLVNLIGDGIYINHQIGATAPYSCPSAVDISNNTFTGTHTNRNGVSLVCGGGITIRNNTFYQMARADMPGTIDMEPNSSDEFINSVDISGNLVQAGDGAAYTVSGILYYDRGAHASVATVSVHNNTVRGSRIKYGIAFYGGFTSARVTGVTISSNDVRNIQYDATSAAIDIEQGVPASVTANIVDNVTGWGILTYQSCVSVSGNTVTNVTQTSVLQSQPTC